MLYLFLLFLSLSFNCSLFCSPLLCSFCLLPFLLFLSHPSILGTPLFSYLTHILSLKFFCSFSLPLFVCLLLFFSVSSLLYSLLYFLFHSAIMSICSLYNLHWCSLSSPLLLLSPSFFSLSCSLHHVHFPSLALSFPSHSPSCSLSPSLTLSPPLLPFSLALLSLSSLLFCSLAHSLPLSPSWCVLYLPLPLYHVYAHSLSPSYSLSLSLLLLSFPFSLARALTIPMFPPSIGIWVHLVTCIRYMRFDLMVFKVMFRPFGALVFKWSLLWKRLASEQNLIAVTARGTLAQNIWVTWIVPECQSIGYIDCFMETIIMQLEM